MGLLQGYLIYKYGKRRGERARREYDDEICDHCGYPRRQHEDDENETCPIYLFHA